jgi:nicotinate-nucleotide pyrophosphorylase (carboxylating)
MIDPPADVVRRIVAAALDEDLDVSGDVTSLAVVAAEARAVGSLVARERLQLAGIPLARAVFERLEPGIGFTVLCRDGERVDAGTVVARVLGSARAILAGERTALNFLMRLSGIATAAAAAVEEIRGTGARILDTRKTTPGLRALEKYAVRAGGADNHRLGLHDAVLIKDTHLASAGSIALAVSRALAAGHPAARVTVEVANLVQLDEACAAGAGRALLDNFTVEQVRAAADRARGRIVLEASGGLAPGRLRPYAEAGVDFLSLGYLTHSSRAMDFALDLEPAP